MIVRMSKIRMVGPKALLQSVLSLLRESGIFQIEPSAIGFLEKGGEEYVRSFLLDEKALSERIFLDGLRLKLDELFSYLPDVPVRNSYIEPLSIIDTIAKTIPGHTAICRDLYQRRDSLQKETAELNRYAVFLGALESLLEGMEKTPDLDFIGLTIKDLDAVEPLKRLLSQVTEGRFEILTAVAADGAIVGLIAVEKSAAEKVRNALSDEHIPELDFPPSLNGLTLIEKIGYLRKRISEASSELKAAEWEMTRFSHRWTPIYKRVKEWIDERLSLLRATASVFETRMCFFIYGWMPSEEVRRIGKELAETFGGQVVIDERGVREEDLELVPVILKNPPYFRPFELFVRIFPLPRYASFDPTPFIGIFFPLFFGMILGDAGYGLILVILSVIAIRKFGEKKDIRNASKILLISSLYTILFGILYGEMFGDFGLRLFGLRPILIERRHAVVPMLSFAVTVGVVHIIVGLSLGFIATIKKKAKKEALSKLLNIIFILCLAALVAAFFGIFPHLLTRPTIIAILVLTPLLLFAGGLLAPFELLRNIGNVISYARIMAIGLTSVLLAYTANRLAGMVGNIVIGILVAVLLHVLNIVLGLFSPAIHSLRLHYVEFFSKFMEHGGRQFEPFKKRGKI